MIKLVKSVKLLLITATLFSCSHSSPISPSIDTTDFAVISSLSNFDDTRKIWKVYANGDIEEIQIQVERDISFTSGEGSTRPVLAFDNSMIAYVYQYNLWLYDLDTKKSQQIIFVGQPQDSIFASIKIFITGWSLSNQKLLYHVSSGPIDCADCDQTWRQREVDFGHYVYDLRTKEHKKVELPGEYSGWTFDESILVRERFPHVISIYSPATTTTTPLATLEYEINQSDISLDGTSMAAAFLDWTNSRTQIIKMNLRAGDIISITDFGPWGEFQRPILSLNGQNISYIQPIRNLEARRIEKYNVIINEEPIYECEFGPRVHWINDRIVAIHCAHQVTVTDIQTKETIAHHNL